MTSGGVLLYRNDEHISSHVDEGQYLPKLEINGVKIRSAQNIDSCHLSLVRALKNKQANQTLIILGVGILHGIRWKILQYISSSQPAYTDDGGYIPQMDYTSNTGSSFHPEEMHGKPPSMQVNDQCKLRINHEE
ncbi:hypothetical protein V6N13_020137 [Hibiscus sabdariffa]